MGRICLKERREYYNHRMSSEEYKKICWDYGRKLEKEGWKECPIEGGCLSPDISTIYIYHRSPYEGELLNFIPNTEKEYKKICDEFVSSGDFINQDDIWKEMEQIDNNLEDIDK